MDTALLPARPGGINAALARRVIQCRFRKDARISSHRQIVEMLQLGYQSLSLLKSLGANTTLSVIANVNYHLSRMDAALGSAKNTTSTSSNDATLIDPPRSDAITAVSMSTPQARVSPLAALDRPLPQENLTGLRQVPRLISTMGIPFLRFTKPQPPVLSQLIRRKIVQKQHRVDQLASLDDIDTSLARHEDSWERRIFGLAKSAGSHQMGEASNHVGLDPFQDGPTYEDSVKLAKAQIIGSIKNESQRAYLLATKLWHIVQQERRLKFEEEGIVVPLLGSRKRKIKEAQAGHQPKERLEMHLLNTGEAHSVSA